MAEKRLSVRFTTDGARRVQTEMEGLGEAGGQAFGTLADRAREMGEAVRTSMLEASRQMRRAGIALTAIGAGVTLALRQQVNAADELGKAASRVGMPVEALSELQFAAEMSGSSLEGLERALTSLSRRAVENPGDFEALGIALRDADGEMRSTEDLLGDVADALAAIPEGAERVAAAQKFMGRTGADLLPMLEAGAAALAEYRREAREMGLTVSGEAAAAAAKFNDNLARLQKTGTALARAVSESLLPALIGLTEKALEVVKAVQALPPEAVEWFAKLAGMVVVGGPLLLGLAAVTKAVALLASPFVLAAAAVGLLVVGLVAAWPHLMRWKDGLVDWARGLADTMGERLSEARDRAAEFVADIADAFWSMKESIEVAVEQALTWVRERFDAMVDWFRELPGRMAQVGRDIIDGLRQGLDDAWQDLKDWAWQKLPELPGWARRIFETQSPSRVFAAIGHDLMDGMRVGMESNMAAPMGTLSQMAQQMKGSFEAAFVGIVTGTVKARDAIAALARDMAQMLARRGFNMLLSSIFGAFSGPTLVSGPSLPAIRPMPRPFEGGGFTGYGPRSGGLDGRGGFMAMLHPNETVIDHTRGDGGGTGRVDIYIHESPAFATRVETVAQGVAVNVTQQALGAYDRQVLPSRVVQIGRQPYRRG